MAALAVPATAVHAHDTWFELLPSRSRSPATLALGTGNRFPLAETAIDSRFFARAGCVDTQGAARDLMYLRYTDRTTELRPSRGASPPATCFVQLQPFEIELPADKVALYFREIRPSPDVERAWAEQQSRGEPFRERYVKSARIELDAAGAARAAGTLMDVVRIEPAAAPAAGTEAVFQVLRDGQPLAGFAVELINERSPLGLWHRTDAMGRVRAKLPLAGRWLLRGTDLRRSPQDPARWESAFVTYAFDVR